MNVIILLINVSLEYLRFAIFCKSFYCYQVGKIVITSFVLI